MSQNYTYPPGFATSVNPSIGINGSPAPTSSTEVGGINPSNNLEALKVDSSGNLLVNISASTLTPLPTTDAADGSVTGGTAGTKSILMGVQYNTSLPTLTTGQQAAWQADSSGRAIISPLTTASVIKTDLQDGSGTAITSTGNALDINLKTSSITLPISGTVTANQGSANATPWNENISEFGGTSVSLGSKVSASSIPVVIASDQGSYTVAATQSGNWSTRTEDGSGNVITSTSNALDVNLKTSSITLTISGTVTANQGSANATPWNENISQYGGTATSLGQKVSASSMPVVIASDQSAIAISGSLSPTKGRSSANAPVYNVYSSTNITTSAYVQLVASTTSTTNYLDIFDSSGQAMIIGVGGSGSEVVQGYVPPGGDQIPLAIPAGSRVAYKALTANATSGYLLVNFYT